MNIWANHIEHLPQSCGITEIGHFRSFGASFNNKKIKDLALKNVGAGWALASFARPAIYDEEYRAAYEELKKKYKIVYQSPVRTNNRTGREFFFCIYDTTKKGN